MPESLFIVDAANILLAKVGLTKSANADFALLENLIVALRDRARYADVKIFLVIADSRFNVVPCLEATDLQHLM